MELGHELYIYNINVLGGTILYNMLWNLSVRKAKSAKIFDYCVKTPFYAINIFEIMFLCSVHIILRQS